MTTTLYPYFGLILMLAALAARQFVARTLPQPNLHLYRDSRYDTPMNITDRYINSSALIWCGVQICR